MPKISVIIPSYNQAEKISECVKSIVNQNFSYEYEIIVVDSSAFEIQSEIESIFSNNKNVRLIKIKQQTYPGTARNIGVKDSLGDIIAFIDSDCIATNNWLEIIHKNIDANIVLSGVIKNGTKNNVFGTCSYLVEFNEFLEFNKERKEISVAATCNFAINKVDFLKVGGFTDDRAFEDFLFCYRFRKLGGEIHQLSKLCIYHLNKTNLANIVSNQKLLGKYSAKVRRKNNMPPNLIFKFPILCFALPGYRYFSIFSRIIKTKHIFKFLLYTPVVMYLLIQWSIGFYAGVKDK